MTLILLGTSHRVADVDWLSQLAFSPPEATIWLREAARDPSLSELLVLSTCNRVEIYAATPKARDGERAVRAAVRRLRGHDLLAPGPRRYFLTGESVCRHLCRVACGLDSMLIGEAEILGQIRRAAAIAADAGTRGPLLDTLLRAALAAGRRARTETTIGVGATSAAAAAVAIAERALGSLQGRTALVIGAGHAGRLAVDRLAKRRIGRLLLANRTREHAERIARTLNATTLSLDAIGTALKEVDLVIAAAPSPHPLVTGPMTSAALAARPDCRLVLVDVSVPPAIDAAAARHSNIAMYGLNDLQQIVDETAERRRLEIPRVERIAAEEAARWNNEAMCEWVNVRVNG